jgi:hypothetical protein
MASKKHLSEEQIRQVHDAAVRAGLSPSRSALLAGIDPRFVLSLPTAPSPSAQLLIDLTEMNRITTLSDGTIPLFDWLRNASLLAGPRYEADVFRVALASAQSPAGAIPAHPALEPARSPPLRFADHNHSVQRGFEGPVHPERGFAPGRLKCFVAYAPQDERFARDLLRHLSIVERAGSLSVRHPGSFGPGDPRDAARSLLLDADVILFMISADLLVDDDARAWVELALARAGEGVRVIPVLTRPVDLSGTPLGAYRPLPTTGEPIAAFKMPDDAYADIARSIRALVTDRARPSASSPPPMEVRVGQRPSAAPTPIADFTEIFSAGTTSEATYVDAVEMGDLMAAMSRGRRGLVVQGPSGCGKTTAVRKLIPEESCWLSAIKRGDLRKLDEILDGAPVSGHLVIDEFHALSTGVQRDVANLIKVTCGERGTGAKITVIGVNNSGEMLFEGNTNLAGRVDFIEMRQRQPDRKLQELVQKGEQSAGVRFANRDALISAARGSFILAQQLCLKALSAVVARPSAPRHVDVQVDELAERVAADLVFFRHPIVDFVRLGEAHLVTLWMLSRKPDDAISLQEVREEFPELEASLDELVARRKEGAGPLRQYLHIDSRGRVICDDVQLVFYLARLKPRDWMSIAQDAGRSAYFDDGVLRLARAAPQGGGPRRSILDLDVEELWVRPEATELLAVLCVAYDTYERVRWIVSLARIPMDEVTQAGGVRDVWVSVLRVAIRSDRMRALLVTIQRDETVARYHHKIRSLIS